MIWLKNPAIFFEYKLYMKEIKILIYAFFYFFIRPDYIPFFTFFIYLRFASLDLLTVASRLDAFKFSFNRSQEYGQKLHAVYSESFLVANWFM